MFSLLKIIQKYCFVLVSIIAFSFASKAQTGFYATDSTSVTGIKLINAGRIINAQWCQVSKENRLVKFSPTEITQYGFDKGATYISKQIPISDSLQHFFLEKLSEKKVTLYYLAKKQHHTFYIEEENSKLSELPKGKKNKDSFFQNKLKEITSDFPEISNNTRLVKYNKKSLTKFFNDYNNHINKPFPHSKFGIIGMYEMSKLLVSKKQNNIYLAQLNYKHEKSFGGGIFVDIPILMSDFSWHLEVLYSKHNYSYFKRIDLKDIDLIATVNSIKIPFLIRYTYPSKRTRPFVNSGVVFTNNFQKDEHLLETTFSENLIEINEISTSSIIGDFQHGIATGIGAEYKINYRRSLFFEVRYNRFFENNSKNTLNNSNIQFITSINI